MLRSYRRFPELGTSTSGGLRFKRQDALTQSAGPNCQAFQAFGSTSISSPEMSETALTVPDMNEPLSRYDVTVTAGCEGGSLPDPAAFAAAADQAAWSRSASIISAHLADKIISVVTVTAPDQYAAVAVARAVVSDALRRQALSSGQVIRPAGTTHEDCAELVVL